MSADAAPLAERPRLWKWWVCGLLLLATTINYMDRVALNVMSETVKTAFGLDDLYYGYLESSFGIAFAFGAILMGWLTDRTSVRWLYPAAVFVWSLAGLATGLVHSFTALLICRFCLGLAESANWPCALQTTKHLLKPEERTMGNGILQSGAAFGAMLMPLMVLLLKSQGYSWRTVFVTIGVLGMFWGVLWLFSVRSRDLDIKKSPVTSSMVGILSWLIALYGLDLLVHLYWHDEHLFGIRLPLLSKGTATVLGIAIVVRWLAGATQDEVDIDRTTFFRRFAVLALIVTVINITWHFFRAWLPGFLQNQHHYTESQMNWFIMAYYVATDIGSLTAGFMTLRLVGGGMSVHGWRLVVYGTCAVLTCLSVVASVLPAGPLLLGLLLVIGFACLGLFPNYYSLSQDITIKHQGKLTGALGCISWLSQALLHEVVGDSVKRSGSYSEGMALVGMLPLVGLAALLLFWDKPERIATFIAPSQGKGRNRRKGRKLAGRHARYAE